MKTITINVSAPTYHDFQNYAAAQDRSTSELIREAMAEYCDRKIRRTTSIGQHRSASVGRVLKEIAKESQWRSEILDDRY